MKQKILIIHRSLGIGGAEKIIAYLANTLADKYNVFLLLLQRQKNTMVLNENVNVIQEDCYFESPILSKRIIQGAKELSRMVNCIKSYEKDLTPSLIISFDLRIMLALGFIKGISAKILLSERADPYQNPRYWQIILRNVYRKADYIVFQTDGARDFYGNLVKQKSCVIANPAFLRVGFQENNIEENDNNYIFSAGRFQRRKGFDLLIRAFADLGEKYSSYRLKLFGEGVLREELINLAKECGVKEKVIFMDPINGVIEKNRNATLFVLPSRSEGIPNIMIEAMAAGIPVVAADCSPGGARLLSEDGKYCLLSFNDDVNSLRDNIRYALDNPREMQELADTAKRSLSRFEPREIGEKWKEIISALI